MGSTETPKGTTPAEIAAEAHGYFETVERSSGETFERLQDGSPEWITNGIVWPAHHVERWPMFPDDFRYGTIRSALGWICDNADETGDVDDDADHEFADAETDIYNGSLCEWLGSHAIRASYCDEAAETFGMDPERGIIGLMQIGQACELRKIFASVLASVRKLAEERDA